MTFIDDMSPLTEEEGMFLIFAFFFQIWSKLSEEEGERIFNV